MKSWKTSLGGILSAVGSALLINGTGTVKQIGEVLAIAGPAIIGLAARDSNVTSEQQGLKT